jgi:hypothetical protein
MKAITDVKAFFLVSASWLLVGCALINPPEDTPPRSSLSNLIITEINYNPYDPLLPDSLLEYVELYNRGQEEISLKVFLSAMVSIISSAMMQSLNQGNSWF